MEIAVVILNWNGKTLLETYLSSVLTYSTNAKIYVADNASTDDSLAFLATNYPEVVVLKNPINLGFAGGYNEALKYVEEDILVLLNNDVEVTKNWLHPITSMFKSSDDIAAIQPKIKSIQNPDYFDYAGAAGGFIDALGYAFCRGRIFDHIEKDLGQYDTDTEIFWASGACLAIKKKCFEDIKGFDESFFAHYEEIDLCWRLKNRGYRIMFCHNSEVYHQGGGTLSNSNPNKTFLNFRNSLSTLYKNSTQNTYLLVLLRMMLDGIAALHFLTQCKLPHVNAIFKAHLSFYKQFAELRQKRSLNLKKRQKFIVKSIVWFRFVLNKHTFERLSN